MKDKKGYSGNIWDRVGSMHCNNFYTDKVSDGDWKEDSAREVKGKFKGYLVVLAVFFVVATVVEFNYLGGIEGILTSEMLGYGKESFGSYVAAVGSLVVFPALGGICLYLAFKRK